MAAPPTAEQVNEALALALQIVERRGDKPSDPKICSDINDVDVRLETEPLAWGV